jgi:hypothetical protein
MALIVVHMAAGVSWAGVIGFDDLSLAPNSYWDGSDGSGGFTSGGVQFSNDYAWGSWSGFAYSNVQNTTTPGFGNLYAAYAANGGGNYAIGYVPLDWMSGTNAPLPISLSLARPSTLGTVQIANTTYAALSMLNGDGFTDKYGGASGANPDWFKLTITGTNAAGAATGSVDFLLADYRGAEDFVIGSWQTIDLSSLGIVSGLTFTLDSSDKGIYGINTPTFFAMDNLTVNSVPEPAAAVFFLTGGVGLLAFRRGLALRRRLLA